MDRAVTHTTRAESDGSRYVATAQSMRGYWYVRDTGQLDPFGRRCYEVAHMQRRDVVVLTDPCNVGHAARVANAMNKLDANADAPIFDEKTGAPIAR